MSRHWIQPCQLRISQPWPCRAAPLHTRIPHPYPRLCAAADAVFCGRFAAFFESADSLLSQPPPPSHPLPRRAGRSPSAQYIVPPPRIDLCDIVFAGFSALSVVIPISLVIPQQYCFNLALALSIAERSFQPPPPPPRFPPSPLRAVPWRLLPVYWPSTPLFLRSVSRGGSVVSLILVLLSLLYRRPCRSQCFPALAVVILKLHSHSRRPGYGSRRHMLQNFIISALHFLSTNANAHPHRLYASLYSRLFFF